MQPITPSEVTGRKAEIMPPEVIASFNDLIAKGWNGSYSKVSQPEVVALICTKMGLETLDERRQVFDDNWLDVESIFEASGWDVEYDKPGYDESYDASFKFSRK